jgi:hypothetical protein
MSFLALNQVGEGLIQIISALLGMLIAASSHLIDNRI